MMPLKRKLLLLLIVVVTTPLSGVSQNTPRNKAMTYQHIADSLSTNGKFREARAFYNQAFLLWSKIGEWELALESKNSIIGNFLRERTIDSAFIEAKITLDEYIPKIDHNHPEVARTHFLLGNSLIYQHRFDSGIKEIEKALAIQLESYPDSMHIYITKSLNSLGSCYMIMRRTEQAISFLKKAENILFKVNPQDKDSLHISILMNLGSAYSQKGEFEGGNDYFLKALKKQEKLSSGKNNLVYSSILNNLGINYQEIERDEESLKRLQSSLKIKMSLTPDDYRNIGNVHNSLAVAYSNLGMKDSAFKNYHKALVLYEKHLGPNDPFLLAPMINIAQYFGGKKSYYKGLEYYKRAENILTKHREKYPLEYYTCIRGQATILREQRVYDKAYNLLTNLLNTQKNATSSDPWLLAEKARIFIQLGLLFIKQNEPEIALRYLEKGLSLELGLPYKKSGAIAEIHWLKGTGYKMLEDYDNAVLNLKLAVSYFLEYTGYKPNLATTYDELASIYYSLGNIDSMFFYQNLALSACSRKREHKNSQFVIPHVMDIISPTFSIGICKSSSELFQKAYYATGDMKYIETALNVIWLCDSLIDVQREFQTWENDKIAFVEQTKAIYEQGLSLASDLYIKTHSNNDLETIFYFIEKSKGYILLSSLMNNEMKFEFGLPDSLVAQEQQLQDLIEYYQLELAQNPEHKERAYFHQQLFEKNRKYELLIQKLQKDFPKYYQSKYQIHLTTLSKYQSKIDANMVALDYFVGSENIYVLAITDSLAKFIIIPQGQKHFQQIERLRNSIQQAADIENFAKNSHACFQAFFQPMAEIVEGKERILICPDGVLHYIPFDALIEDTTNLDSGFRYLPYLIKKHVFSYSYSLSLLEIMDNLSHAEFGGKIAGFAPQYNSDSIPELHSGMESILALEESLHAKAFVGENVTKALFESEAPKYDILCLTTHVVLNDTLPLKSYFRFHNSTLETWEVHGMALDASLVVLSGCETGFGEIATGEGIMSISRSFLAAKCPSIIMTQWHVNDRSTSLITSKFFEGVTNGLYKDESLQQAKVEYIKNAQLGTDTHPYYWAGIVGLGDMSPLKFKSQSKLPWILLIAFGVIILAVITARKARKNYSL